MTATVALVRHAAHGQLGRTLSGRLPALPLTPQGAAQAEALGAALAATPLAAVQASPQLRARQTAEAIAAHHAAAVEIAPALDEIDFGDWTGRDYDALEADPDWRQWNARRAGARAPGGEAMAEAQARAVRQVDAAAAAHPGDTVAIVSHCDIIRAVIAHYIGLSLDHLLRFDVAPASVSTLEVGEWGGRLVRLNAVAA